MVKFLKVAFKKLFQVFVFLLPVQLGYHFWPTWAFVFGIRVDYLSPTVYLTDILFLIILLLFLITQKPGKKSILLGLVMIGIIGFLNLTSSASFQPALFKWIKILELFSLGTIVAKTKELKVEDWIIQPLFWSMVVVSIIAVLQVVNGGSLGGPFYFLGERAFSLSTPGIALASLGGREILRAYSTFSHPNSLAGFLGAGLIISWPFLLKRPRRISSFVFLVMITVSFLLTFSLAPALSLLAIAGIVFFLGKNPSFFGKITKGILFFLAVLSLIFPLVASRAKNLAEPFGESYSRRLDLGIAAGKMFSEKPFWGIGLNNFTVGLPQESVVQPLSWWLQPVHNIFLLSLSETGLAGFLLLVFLFYSPVKKASFSKKYLVAALLFVVMTGFFDHYWLTLQQNQLLLATIFGLSYKNG